MQGRISLRLRCEVIENFSMAKSRKREIPHSADSVRNDEMRVVRKPLRRALPEKRTSSRRPSRRRCKPERPTTDRLAEGLEISPEGGPGLAKAAADEHGGILDGFFVGGAVAVPRVAGKLARCELRVHPLGREAHDN